MAKNQRSFGRYLVLTAWESWSVEAHWRNAVIIAIVGSIAFMIASPKPNYQGGTSTSSNPPILSGSTPPALQPGIPGNIGNVTTPSTVSPLQTFTPPVSQPKAPLQIKPALSDEDVIIEETKSLENTPKFGTSYGD